LSHAVHWCVTHRRQLSAVSYDPLSHSRHNAGDRSTKVGHAISSLTDACMVWRHGIFQTTSSASPIPIAAVSDRRHPTYTAVPYRRSCVSGGWKLRYLSSNTDCVSKPPQNLPLFPIISFLIVLDSFVQRVGLQYLFSSLVHTGHTK